MRTLLVPEKTEPTPQNITENPEEVQQKLPPTSMEVTKAEDFFGKRDVTKAQDFYAKSF